ncbi:unnamed protein product [Ambrosiozyma monospora]|uniref:Unnamed protein product n=1 Tax=Ambrosiozyma monospora TaxID=43982 RepID=A0ACB5TVC6_AMBMO|nr:unnamed protein product [Ambrosiozyma monospora]
MPNPEPNDNSSNDPICSGDVLSNKGSTPDICLSGDTGDNQLKQTSTDTTLIGLNSGQSAVTLIAGLDQDGSPVSQITTTPQYSSLMSNVIEEQFQDMDVGISDVSQDEEPTDVQYSTRSFRFRQFCKRLKKNFSHRHHHDQDSINPNETGVNIKSHEDDGQSVSISSSTASSSNPATLIRTAFEHHIQKYREKKLRKQQKSLHNKVQAESQAQIEGEVEIAVDVQSSLPELHRAENNHQLHSTDHNPDPDVTPDLTSENNCLQPQRHSHSISLTSSRRVISSPLRQHQSHGNFLRPTNSANIQFPPQATSRSNTSDNATLVSLPQQHSFHVIHSTSISDSRSLSNGTCSPQRHTHGRYFFDGDELNEEPICEAVETVKFDEFDTKIKASHDKDDYEDVTISFAGDKSDITYDAAVNPQYPSSVIEVYMGPDGRPISRSQFPKAMYASGGESTSSHY